MTDTTDLPLEPGHREALDRMYAAEDQLARQQTLTPFEHEPLYVYGCSDDLIEFEGAYSDELGARYNRATKIAVYDDSDRRLAVIKAEYDPDGTGEWRLVAVASLAAEVEVVRAYGEEKAEAEGRARNDEHGCPAYSDKAIVRSLAGLITRVEVEQ